jgi:D-alanyl-D-alanine carboxypeptidase
MVSIQTKEKTMKIDIRLSLIVIVLFLLGCSKNDIHYNNLQNNALQSQLQTIVDQLLSDYTTKYPGYPGGLALQVISKKQSWFVYSGMDPGISNQTHFRAASITKSFTATAILLLHQQGRLNINDPITGNMPGTNIPYVPGDENYAIPYKEQITIHQLLQHKAGVFDITNDLIPDTVSADVPYKGHYYVEWILEQDPTHTFTFDELLEVNAVCQLSYFKPGTGYHYSNIGYSILGKIIERVSGMTFADFVLNHVIVPMGLTHTTLPFLGTDQNLPEPFSPGFYYLPEIMNCTESNVSANVAGGNIVSTPYDLASFIRTLIRGEGVLSSYTVNSLMLSPLIPPDTMTGEYFCGIMSTKNLGYGHTGLKVGYITVMVTDPEIDFTAVAYTNAWNLSTGDLSGLIEQLKNYLEESAYKAKYLVNGV